jgi:hypothetical protein
MESSNSPPHSTSSAPKVVMPVDLLVSVATVPMVLGLVGTRVLFQVTQQLGQLSEEMFRGDRLPLLKFPNHSSPSIDTGDTD